DLVTGVQTCALPISNLAPNRKKIMKSSNRLLIAAAALALFASASQIKAQSQAVGDDGIAASPKVRQMLNEWKARAAAPQQVTIRSEERRVGNEYKT